MGHLINPKVIRLGLNMYWNSNWSIYNKFIYYNIFKIDYILFEYLNWFIKKYKFIKLSYIISFYKIYKIHNLIYINLYFYNNYKIKKNLNKNKILNSFNFNNYNNKILNKNKIFIKLNNVIKLLISNLYWFLLVNIIMLKLKILSKNNIYNFNIYNFNLDVLNPNIISSYLIDKLMNQQNLLFCLQPILKDLQIKIIKKKIIGYKIACSGRFSRKQIASRIWRNSGSINFNTFSNLIKYSFNSIRLKYGICGIKIWINYGSNNNYNLISKRNLELIYPMYRPLKYKNIWRKKLILLFLNNWLFSYLKILTFKNKNLKYYKWFLKVKLFNFFNTLLSTINNTTIAKKKLIKFNINYLNSNLILIDYNIYYNKKKIRN